MILVFGVGCATATPIERAVPVSGTLERAEPEVIHGRERIAREANWRSAAPAAYLVEPAELDYLGRCARDFILAQPETARPTLAAAFSHYVTQCDDETGKLVLERPLGVENRRSHTDVVFRGTLSPRGSELTLKLTSCGDPRVFERVAITGSGQRWTSHRLEVRRGPDGCDVGELPYTPKLAALILAVTQRAGTISFVGTDNEIAIDPALRDELRGVVDAVDAITE